MVGFIPELWLLEVQTPYRTIRYPRWITLSPFQREPSNFNLIWSARTLTIFSSWEDVVGRYRSWRGLINLIFSLNLQTPVKPLFWEIAGVQDLKLATTT